MQSAKLDDSQTRIKIAGRNINNFRHADDTTIMEDTTFSNGRKWGETKEPLDEGEKGD